MNTNNRIKMLLTTLFVIVFTFIAPQVKAGTQTVCNEYRDSQGNVTTICDTFTGPSDNFGKPYVMGGSIQ